VRVVGVCVAAAFVITTFGAEPVSAADLGGDCCADLEERIAELEATTARKGNRKVSLKIYGNINKSVLWWDDGTEQNVYVVTNQTTRNVLGFEGSAQINPKISAGYRLELEVRTASSDFVDQGPRFVGDTFALGDEGFTGITIRQSNWWLEHKDLGRLTVGRVSNATDGIAEIDLSGSTAAAGSAVEAWNESFFVRDKNTGAFIDPAGGSPEGQMIDIFRGNLDGGVGDFVRYDSPVVEGFIVSAAWGEDDDWDAAVRYAGEFGGFQIAAGFGYHTGVIFDTDNFTVSIDHEEWVGSGSVLHVGTGLFATVAAGSREWDSPGISGEDYIYAKSGIYQKWIELGKTSVYGEYYHTWDVGSDLPLLEESASMWGAGVVQHVDAAALELYLAYRHYWADDVTDTNLFPLTTEHSIKMDMVMGGARIQF
jgi:hypothetical protein